MIVLDVNPIGKPRMTQSDRWKGRDCVERYYEFKDRVKEVLGDRQLYHPAHVIFVIPMPQSWTKKRKKERLGTLHDQKPDFDNLAKALYDSVYSDDSRVADVRVTKVWGESGKIVVLPMESVEELWQKFV